MNKVSFWSFLFFLILINFFNLNLRADVPDTLWTGIYGGESEDKGYSGEFLNNGEYIYLGHTYSFGAGAADIIIHRLTSEGDSIAALTYGGSSDDFGRSIRETQSGGYAIGGFSKSFGNGQFDAYILRLCGLGGILWDRTFGGIYNDKAFSVVETSNRSVAAVGYTESFSMNPDTSDIFIMKVGESGDSLWWESYGGADYDYGRWIEQTSDGGFIITGWTFSTSGVDADLFLMKLGSHGDSLWSEVFGTDSNDYGYCIRETMDRGYIICGTGVFPGNINRDIYLVKTDSTGELEWERYFGGTGEEEGRCVYQTEDSGYVVTGYTDSFGNGGYDVYLLGINSGGDSLWATTTGSSDDDCAYSVEQTQVDGGFFIVGCTGCFSLNQSDIYVIKTGPVSGVDEYLVEDRIIDFKIYPNPFINETEIILNLEKSANVEIEVFNICGHKIRNLRRGTMESGRHRIVWRGKNNKGINVPSGIYILNLKVNNSSTTEKITIFR